MQPLRPFQQTGLSLFGAALCAVVCACGDASTPAPSASSSAAAPPSASAAASAARPKSTALAPSGVEGPPAAGELARLPRGGSTYTAMRAEMVDVMAPLVPQLAQVLEGLSSGGKGKKLSATLADMGVDVSKPLLSATYTRGLDVAKRLHADARANPRSKALDAVDHAGSFIRYELPLVATADPKKLIPLLQAVAGPRDKAVECPSGPGCAEVGGDGLVAVVLGDLTGVSLRVRDGRARIDYVAPFGQGTTQYANGLKFFDAEPLGGPGPGHCALFDATAQASVCVDAQRSGEGFAASQYAIATGGVTGASQPFTPDENRTILDRGEKKAELYLALVTPSKIILDDGTLLLTGAATKPRMRMTWAIADGSRPALEAAFGTPVCGQGGPFVDSTLDKLITAFGSGGEGLADLAGASKQFERIDPNLVLPLWARVWPNYAAPMKAKLTSVLQPLLGASRACLKVHDGRLELEADAVATR